LAEIECKLFTARERFSHLYSIGVCAAVCGTGKGLRVPAAHLRRNTHRVPSGGFTEVDISDVVLGSITLAKNTNLVEYNGLGVKFGELHLVTDQDST